MSIGRSDKRSHANDQLRKYLSQALVGSGRRRAAAQAGFEDAI
jgi:hypothetical protein